MLAECAATVRTQVLPLRGNEAKTVFGCRNAARPLACLQTLDVREANFISHLHFHSTNSRTGNSEQYKGYRDFDSDSNGRLRKPGTHKLGWQ